MSPALSLLDEMADAGRKARRIKMGVPWKRLSIVDREHFRKVALAVARPLLTVEADIAMMHAAVEENRKLDEKARPLAASMEYGAAALAWRSAARALLDELTVASP